MALLQVTMLHTRSYRTDVIPVINPRNPDKEEETFPEVGLLAQDLT